MKRFVFIALLICISITGLFAQQEVPVDKEKMAALMKQLEALKRIDKSAISRNPDSAMALYRKAMKASDSLRNGIVHEALKSAPQGALAERYLNTKTFSDTTYTTVQFMGRMDGKAAGSGDVTHIAANCTAESAPLVQHGSSFTVKLMSNEQVNYEAGAVAANKKPTHMVKYVIQRTKMESFASLSSVVKYLGSKYNKQTHELRYEPVTVTTNTSNRGKTKQFIFSFDTLTNIGQVSYLEVLPATTVTVGGDSAGTRQHALTAGISAITDPKNYKLNEWSKDSAMKKLDTLTKGKLFNAKASEGGEAMPVLLVEKTKTGFKLTCRSTITKNGETTNINITAFIGRPLTEYEAIIKPVEEGDFKYEKWLPKGPKVDGSDDTKGDDSLQFYVEVRSRKDPAKKYNGNFKVEWRLEDVTKYAGFCNNYPGFDESSDINFDLKFDPLLAQDPNYNADLTDGTMATTKDDKGKFAFVHLISMDYAAWGRLKAFVTLDDGSFPIVADPYYKKDLGYLTIPYDLDENRLADQWEINNKVYKKGFALTWDEDNLPEHQKGNGDGFTLFEEYRGFAVHKPNPVFPEKPDMFERTDPNKKDAFVFDRDKLFEDYYEKDNPSNLNWHYVVVNKKQFINREPDIKDPMHRVVNFNKVPEYFYNDQFCVSLYKEEHLSYDPRAIGITWSRGEYDLSALTAYQKLSDYLSESASPEDREKGKALKAELDKQRAAIEKKYAQSGDSPLKTFIKASIYPIAMHNGYQSIKNPVEYVKIIKALTKTSVIHEVGHNIGIIHHQGPSGALNTPAITQADAASSDGVLSCAMRYPNIDESFDISALSTVYNTYCKKNDPGVAFIYTYHVNANGKRIDADAEGRTITPKVTTTPKPSDNCYGQIMLKGKPN